MKEPCPGAPSTAHGIGQGPGRGVQSRQSPRFLLDRASGALSAVGSGPGTGPSHHLGTTLSSIRLPRSGCPDGRHTKGPGVSCFVTLLGPGRLWEGIPGKANEEPSVKAPERRGVAAMTAATHVDRPSGSQGPRGLGHGASRGDDVIDDEAPTTPESPCAGKGSTAMEGSRLLRPAERAETGLVLDHPRVRSAGGPGDGGPCLGRRPALERVPRVTRSSGGRPERTARWRTGPGRRGQARSGQTRPASRVRTPRRAAAIAAARSKAARSRSRRPPSFHDRDHRSERARYTPQACTGRRAGRGRARPATPGASRDLARAPSSAAPGVARTPASGALGGEHEVEQLGQKTDHPVSRSVLGALEPAVMPRPVECVAEPASGLWTGGPACVSRVQPVRVQISGPARAGRCPPPICRQL